MTANLTPWETISSTLSFRSKDAQFWWDRTGRMFAKLIESAGYTTEEQYRELQFYALFVAPQLGPAPDESMPWDILRTPDQTPIDFSWEWRSETEGVLRYTFEPIVAAGQHLSGLRNPTQVWLQTLQSNSLFPGLDLEWYDHFVSMMVPPGLGHKNFDASFYSRTTAEYGTAVAVDANKDGKTVKAYFWPSLSAAELGISSLECVKRAIRALPAEQLQGLQVESTFDFLDEATEKWGVKVNLFSIDCLSPRDARIKIYVSSPYTSQEFVVDALSLGGRVPVADDSALASVTALWDTFLGEAPDKLSDELLAKSTPGFYLTLGSGGVKSAKLYMSPQYWCTSDAEVLSKLRQYFASQQQSDYMMNKYESAVRQVL
ncbi:4-O-dimethylallyl-L-tyrosine synthase [Lachnellula occidentalis]|uniref:4-O-dimethylallyl-L-tyrosine synthase n=1 Tax=Lachnellula occidentalis TaxID=215460 RepID=A0A8H8UEI6_9HELO|nr:4-O-dimethylallyl-L-tyrosine synthase [Lachnellula occidentalis]